MNGAVRALKWLGYSLLYAVAGLLLLAAVATVVARAVLSSADSYRNEIESWVSQLVGQQVQIGAMSAAWDGVDPELVLEDVGFYTADHSRFFAQFKRAHIGLNLLASIAQRQAVPGVMTVDGARLEIVRRADGVLTVDGLAAGKTPTTAADTSFSDWLLGQRSLRLSQSEITFVDGDAPPRVFRDVNLALHNRDAHHYLDGTMFLPKELGLNFNFAADIEGNPFVGRDWSAKLYLNGAGLNLAQLAAGHDVAGARVEQGLATFRAWGDWREGKLMTVRAELLADGLRAVSPGTGRVAAIEALSATVAAENVQQEWRVAVSLDKIQSDDGVWPASRLDLRVQSNPLTVDATLTHLNVEDFGRLLSTTNTISARTAELLYNARPRGLLHNLAVTYSRPVDAAPTYTFRADFEQVGTDSWEKIPGLENFHGALDVTQAGGHITLEGADFVLNYPWLFRSPLKVAQASSQITISHHGDDWTVESDNVRVLTPDGPMAGRVKVTVPTGDASAFADLAFRTEGVNVEATKALSYVPMAVLPKGLVRWLDSSIKGGRLTSAAVLLYGPVRDWPFPRGQGKFDVVLGVSGGVLNHTDGYPVIEAIEGEFRYRGNDLAFDGRSARLFTNVISNAHVAIADLAAPSLTLTVAAHAQGASADKLRYLHSSPLEGLFAKPLGVLELSGPSTLDIDLRVPFAENEKVTVNGVVKLDKNRLKSGEYKLDIHDLSGELKFDENGVSSPKLIGQLGNIAVETSVRSQVAQLPHQLFITSKAALTAKDFGQLLGTYGDAAHLAKYLEGRTDTSLEVRIPMGQESAGTPMSLHLKSDLKGLGILLPKPIQKTADSSRPFALDLDLAGDPRALRFNYGYVGGLFEIVRTATGLSVRRGGVTFGGEASLPSEYGFRVTGGIDEFSWGAWSDALKPAQGEPPLFSGGGSSTQFFDLRFSKLEIFGVQFKDVGIQASNSSQGWSVHGTGPEVEGRIYFPSVAKSAPLVIDMDRLFITTDPVRAASSPIDPRTLPEAKVTSRNFRYNGLELGQLQLEASRTEGGLHLDGLRLKTGTTEIDAKGDWTIEGARQRSAFDIDMQSADMGKTLGDWGYAGTMAGGRTAMKIVANWNGSPADFAFERLSGNTSLRIEKGRLLEVDPGAAKIFGLVSIAALPRRLLGDFGDVSRKGMTFDAIVGEYELKNGNAFTSGLIVDGPTARLGLAGRIGLAKRDYDQVITAVPPALDSLPLLGVAVTAAPPIGATIFVVQRLFKKYFDDLTAVQYTVVGGWDNPVITKVDKPTAEPERNILDE